MQSELDVEPLMQASRARMRQKVDIVPAIIPLISLRAMEASRRKLFEAFAHSSMTNAQLLDVTLDATGEQSHLTEASEALDHFQ